MLGIGQYTYVLMRMCLISSVMVVDEICEIYGIIGVVVCPLRVTHLSKDVVHSLTGVFVSLTQHPHQTENTTLMSLGGEGVSFTNTTYRYMYVNT